MAITTFASFKAITFISLGLLLFSCQKWRDRREDEIEYNPVISGIIIGMERCKGVDSLENWLIDFTWRENSPQIGDTLVLDGFQYTNVLKMKVGNAKYRRVGAAIAVSYTNIIPNKVSNSCAAQPSNVFSLKEMIPEAIGYPGN